MCLLIRHIICESLVEIQQFRHRWSSIMYENTRKAQLNQRPLHNMQLHLAYRYIKMCVLIRHTFCESLLFVIVCLQGVCWTEWMYNFKKISVQKIFEYIFTHMSGAKSFSNSYTKDKSFDFWVLIMFEWKFLFLLLWLPFNFASLFCLQNLNAI